MTPGVLIRYLLGQAAAIKAVAASRAAFPTGIALVFITTIPRNYDQTFILEAPGKWLFGNLAFSLVSGTWLYLVAYACTARLKTQDEAGQRPGFWSAWPAFMGLFWFTAPIAWLYAIPVERFLGELDAAKANLTLLGLVSVWRVALMIRVLRVVTGAPWYATVSWVLTSVCVETFFVTLFGGVFAKNLAAGMAGMRYSPAEELVLSFLGNVMGTAFYGVPLTLVASIVALKMVSPDFRQFPPRQSERPGWLWLTVAGSLWLAIAIPAQRQTRNNAEIDRLTRNADYAAAVRHMAARTSADYAPARPLPPKAFEYEIFEQLPAFLSLISTNDPPWLREHFVTRAREFTIHFEPWAKDRKQDVAEWSQRIAGRDAYFEFTQHLAIVTNLARFPEGRQWLRTNTLYVPALEQYADDSAPLHEGSAGRNPIRHLRREP